MEHSLDTDLDFLAFEMLERTGQLEGLEGKWIAIAAGGALVEIGDSPEEVVEKMGEREMYLDLIRLRDNEEGS